MASPARIFLASGVALVIGMVSGAYAMTLVYGDSARDPLDPSPDPQQICPPCPECQACPPPPDCGESGIVPETAEIMDPPEIDIPESPRGLKSGLPAVAIQQALQAVRASVATCREQEDALDAHGMILLSLTVTATGGQGFISDAVITQRSGQPDALEPCIQQQARRARFEWEGADGEQRVKLPIKVTSP